MINSATYGNNDENSVTDLQFKYQLRKTLTALKRKLDLLNNEEYDKLKNEYLQEIDDISKSLQD